VRAGRANEDTFRKKRKAKYFCKGGLDDPNQIEMAEEIRFFAHADLRGLRRLRTGRIVKIDMIGPVVGQISRTARIFLAP
jgi:hypothetical protein